MCGIAGIIDFENPGVDRLALEAMSRTISSRGPDDDGLFVANHAGLAHRRLAIIDLKSGHQPMSTTDARFTIVFNGEIYNYKELRAELENQGVAFRTNSDTEVLLKLYAREKERSLTKLNGMFSFAVWDAEENEIFLARDRMGKKPLYYARTKSGVVFASELKAVLKNPHVAKELDPASLSLFFAYEYVPAPHTPFKGIQKLKAGHYLRVDKEFTREARFDNIHFLPKSEDDENTACKKLTEKLLTAVNYRLIADVPVGIFLSGGLDSSATVALATELRPAKDTHTFSINFDESSYDESLYSSAVAKKFGTDHHTETLSAGVMIDILPEVARYLDEPFADASILPTYLLSRFTKKHVTAALGGDGADELFAGYPTFLAARLAKIYESMPRLFKNGVSKLATSLPVSEKDMSFDFKLCQFLTGVGVPGETQQQQWLSGISPTHFGDLFTPDFNLKIGPFNPFDLITDEMKNCDTEIGADRLHYFYQKFYLCDDILAKVDRASMANSLEVRAPFLDPNVVNYVNSLPAEFKLKGVTLKYLLKKAFNRRLPAMITQRSKKGFGIPLTGWLKRELKAVLEETLSPERLKRDGIFNPSYVARLLKEHAAGKANHRKPLFSLLMLHLWMDNYL